MGADLESLKVGRERHISRGAAHPQTAHWPESRLESPVIPFDPVVLTLDRVVGHLREEFLITCSTSGDRIGDDHEPSFPMTSHQHPIHLDARGGTNGLPY